MSPIELLAIVAGIAILATVVVFVRRARRKRRIADEVSWRREHRGCGEVPD